MGPVSRNNALTKSRLINAVITAVVLLATGLTIYHTTNSVRARSDAIIAVTGMVIKSVVHNNGDDNDDCDNDNNDDYNHSNEVI